MLVCEKFIEACYLVGHIDPSLSESSFKRKKKIQRSFNGTGSSGLVTSPICSFERRRPFSRGVPQTFASARRTKALRTKTGNSSQTLEARYVSEKEVRDDANKKRRIFKEKKNQDIYNC